MLPGGEGRVMRMRFNNIHTPFRENVTPLHKHTNKTQQVNKYGRYSTSNHARLTTYDMLRSSYTLFSGRLLHVNLLTVNPLS